MPRPYYSPAQKRIIKKKNQEDIYTLVEFDEWNVWSKGVSHVERLVTSGEDMGMENELGNGVWSFIIKRNDNSQCQCQQ